MTNRLLHLIATEPVYTCHWAVLLSELILEPTEIVITGTDALLLREQLHQHYLPFSITAGGTTESLLPLLEGRAAKNKTLIYVCRNKTCQLPVTTVTDTLEQVRRL